MEISFKIKLSEIQIVRVFFSDYDEIQNDQRRMEHFKTLIMLLQIFFGDEEDLDEKKMLEFFGKVFINLSRIQTSSIDLL